MLVDRVREISSPDMDRESARFRHYSTTNRMSSGRAADTIVMRRSSIVSCARKRCWLASLSLSSIGGRPQNRLRIDARSVVRPSLSLVAVIVCVSLILRLVVTADEHSDGCPVLTCLSRLFSGGDSARVRGFVVVVYICRRFYWLQFSAL